MCRQPIIDKSPYENNKKKQSWVQCSNLQCKRSFHISCALMLEPNIKSLLDGSWVCLVCEKKRGIFIKQSLILCLFFDYFLKYSTYLNFYFIYQVIHTRKEPWIYLEKWKELKAVCSEILQRNKGILKDFVIYSFLFNLTGLL